MTEKETIDEATRTQRQVSLIYEHVFCTKVEIYAYTVESLALAPLSSRQIELVLPCSST